MRVKDKDLRYALCSAPTSHWRGVLKESLWLIENGTICVYAGVRVVDDTAWRNAMQKLCRLPSGGRHVAEARWQLSWALDRALNFEEEKVNAD